MFNKSKLCRGRLVQRETVCLRIQRSEFDSRRNRWMFFLAVAIECGTPNISNYFSAKIVQRHLLDIIGSGLYTLSLCEKERTYNLDLWGRGFKRWATILILYCAILKQHNTTTYYNTSSQT